VSGYCSSCRAALTRTVVDLGLSPVSNQFRSADRLQYDGQTFYPLTLMVCERCWLVQLRNVETPPHFTDDYAYFSSHSTSWLEHARGYAQSMLKRLDLNARSLVVEVASNDGYLLKNFKQAGVPVLGIEPTANTAEHARVHHDIESIVDFFGARLGQDLARKGYRADLICGNNVLAHVPDINDFVAGIPLLLKPGGTATFEFPHVLKMLAECQFDTIYHEHFSYLSLLVIEQVFDAHGLEVYGVEELATHGGSLRVYAAHAGSDVRDVALAAGRDQVRQKERAAGLDRVDTYGRFGDQVIRRKLDLLEFLIAAKRNGKKVIGYGAPAKGNTLLNYCGVGQDLIAYTVDRSPAKQGKYLPGVNLLVRTPEDLMADRPDFILILPWNLRDEIAGQLAAAREWGAQFVVAIPEVQVF
jgi:SAM-dependent methyltransferase